MESIQSSTTNIDVSVNVLSPSSSSTVSNSTFFFFAGWLPQDGVLDAGISGPLGLVPELPGLGVVLNTQQLSSQTCV